MNNMVNFSEATVLSFVSIAGVILVRGAAS